MGVGFPYQRRFSTLLGLRRLEGGASWCPLLLPTISTNAAVFALHKSWSCLMATYLLTWNPLKWDWKELPVLSKAVSSGQLALEQWSCGNSKRIRKGDRLFMLVLGESLDVNKGIFASGFAQRDSYRDLHWDKQRRERGETCQYTDILFDVLLNPFYEIGIPRTFLENPPFTNVNWSTQSSGITIPDEVAPHLEKVWLPITQTVEPSEDSEIILREGQIYYEGTAKQVTLTRYERNKKARLECIQHYGTACVICEFDFGETYGALGAGFIHVHHIIPLSEIRDDYRVDPVNDLRPVCPNCHAMIHRKIPAFEIDEVKSLLTVARS